jgi:hypothetical protein
LEQQGESFDRAGTCGKANCEPALLPLVSPISAAEVVDGEAVPATRLAAGLAALGGGEGETILLTHGGERIAPSINKPRFAARLACAIRVPYAADSGVRYVRHG